MSVKGFLTICLLLILFGAADSQLGDDGAPPPASRVEIPVSPVGVLYSPATRQSLGWRWDWEFSGVTHTLDSLGVDYQVLSPEELSDWDGKILVLANVRNMSARTVERIQGLQAKVLATYMTSYRSDSNEPWAGNNFALADLLGIRFHSWVGAGEKVANLHLTEGLGGRELPLGRGQAMLVSRQKSSRVLARWSDGEPAIVESERGIFLGEDLFCPENSDSKPVLELLAQILNRLQPNVARLPKRVTYSELPHPPATELRKCGRRVRVGLGTLQGETLLRSSQKLTVNGRSQFKFHRWTKNQELEVTGEPYVEVLRLRENGSYRWAAYRGTLNISADGSVVNALDFEEYLSGVVPGEVPSYFPQESLKAMAVVARTYGLSHLGRHTNFDVCDTVHCQVYRGLGQESEATNLAVSETTGELLTFAGEPVNALFHAVCGGTTASSTEAWPGGAERPYLCSRDDGRFCADSGRYRWHEEYSREDLTQKLREGLRKMEGEDFQGLSTLLSLTVEQRSQSGRVKVLKIEAPEATYRVEGDAIRWLFSAGEIGTTGLQSTLFEVSTEGDRTIFDGGGWGHGVGLCQQGASGRALAGQSYRTILEHYYPNTALTAWQDWDRRAAKN